MAQRFRSSIASDRVGWWPPGQHPRRQGRPHWAAGLWPVQATPSWAAGGAGQAGAGAEQVCW